MNSAEYVDQQIKAMKSGGIPLSSAAWQAALLCIGWPYVFGDLGQTCTPENRQQAYNRTAAGKNKDNIKNKCQVLNGSRSSCTGCKWFPDGKRVRCFDCRGFTRWILQQVFNWTLQGAGCTSQWNKAANWKAKGEVKDGIPQDTIVCLFYYKKDASGKRTKTLEHTGLYYNGETCECSNGVEYSKTLNKKWEVWGVPACVSGDVPDPGEKKPTLRKGSTGPYVVECQTDLITLRYDLSPYGADGKYGDKTISAVKQFQSTHCGPDGKKLTVDGVTGQNTWWALDQAVGPEPGPVQMYTVTVPHLTNAEAEELIAQYPGATKAEENAK